MVTPSEARGAPGAPVRMRDGVGLEAGHAVVATDPPDDPGVARKPMTDQEVEEALPPQPFRAVPWRGGDIHARRHWRHCCRPLLLR